MSQFITTTEAARIIGCVPSRVRQLLLSAKLKGERHGRDWMVDRASAEAYRDTARRPGRKPNTNGGDCGEEEAGKG